MNSLIAYGLEFKNKYKTILSLLILIFALSFSTFSCTKPKKNHTHINNPVHVYAIADWADDLQVPWDMLLSMEVETFEKPLTFSEAKTLDPVLNMAARVAESLSNGNYEFIHENIYAEGVPGNAPTQKFMEFFKKLTKSQKNLFTDGRILKRVRLGDRTVLLYSFMNGENNNRAFARFMIDEDGKIKHLWGLTPTLDSLIINTLVNGKEIKPLPTLKEDEDSVRQIPGYRSFPLRYKDFKAKFLPVLHFKGQAHLYKIADAKAEKKEEHPVIQFYKEAALSWKSGDLKEIAKYYGPKSKATVTDWLKRAGKRGIEQYGDLHNYRVVRYILEADPMYLVFYNPFSRPIPDQSNLYFDYIFKKENGKYQTVNFSTKTRITYLIEEQDFIQREIFPQLNDK